MGSERRGTCRHSPGGWLGGAALSYTHIYMHVYLHVHVIHARPGVAVGASLLACVGSAGGQLGAVWPARLGLGRSPSLHRCSHLSQRSHGSSRVQVREVERSRCLFRLLRRPVCFSPTDGNKSRGPVQGPSANMLQRLDSGRPLFGTMNAICLLPLGSLK